MIQALYKVHRSDKLFDKKIQLQLTVNSAIVGCLTRTYVGLSHTLQHRKYSLLVLLLFSISISILVEGISSPSMKSISDY